MRFLLDVNVLAALFAPTRTFLVPPGDRSAVGGSREAIRKAPAGLERDCQGSSHEFDTGIRELASDTRYANSLLVL